MIRRLLLTVLAYLALQSGQNTRSGRVTDDDGRAFEIEVGGVAATLLVSGSVAAPGANGTVAVIVAPTPGVYRVRGFLMLTGTAETQLVNGKIRVNGAAITGGGAGSLIPTLTGVLVPFDFNRVVVGAGNIDIVAAAAATAGSIYTAMLTATRVE